MSIFSRKFCQRVLSTVIRSPTYISYSKPLKGKIKMYVGCCLKIQTTPATVSCDTLPFFFNSYKWLISTLMTVFKLMLKQIHTL